MMCVLIVERMVSTFVVWKAAVCRSTLCPQFSSSKIKFLIQFWKWIFRFYVFDFSKAQLFYMVWKYFTVSSCKLVCKIDFNVLSWIYYTSASMLLDKWLWFMNLNSIEYLSPNGFFIPNRCIWHAYSIKAIGGDQSHFCHYLMS